MFGVLLLVDVEVDRALAIDAGGGVGLALALDQGAEVGQGQRQAVAARHHQVLEFARVAHLALDPQQRVLRVVRQQAHRLVGVGLAQRGGHLRRRDAVGAQAHRVEVDAHLAQRQARDLDPGHALHALQPLADVSGRRGSTARAHCACSTAARG